MERREFLKMGLFAVPSFYLLPELLLEKGKSSLDISQSNVARPILYPGFTFETFVVASCNKDAHWAALQVAESPGRIYNPLFIQSGVGQGKTHLLMAIAHRVTEGNPGLHAIYRESYDFTSEVVDSIRNGKRDGLRKKYTNADIFLIDDVRFIQGKPQTQQELTYILKHLYEKQKQIVMACTVRPEDISDVTNELRTILTKSLVVSIQPPAFDTRLAVIHKKAEDEKINIPEDVAQWLAAEQEFDIRILEHYLFKLNEQAKLNRTAITLDMAKNICAIK